MSEPTARELLDRMSNARGWAGMLDLPARDLAARVEAVLELHKPVRTGVNRDGSPYMQCDCCGGKPPCPTVRLLNGDSVEEPEHSHPPTGPCSVCGDRG